MLAAPHRALGGRDLVERSADVNRGGLETARIRPRDRSVEGPIELEDTGAVTESAEPFQVAVRQRRLANGGELARIGVEEVRTRRREIGGGADRDARADRAAQLAQVARERVCDRS